MTFERPWLVEPNEVSALGFEVVVGRQRGEPAVEPPMEPGHAAEATTVAPTHMNGDFHATCLFCTENH
jgi:hypothetical protein